MTEVGIPCRLPGKEVPRAYCAGVLGGRGRKVVWLLVRPLGEQLHAAVTCLLWILGVIYSVGLIPTCFSVLSKFLLSFGLGFRLEA